MQSIILSKRALLLGAVGFATTPKPPPPVKAFPPGLFDNFNGDLYTQIELQRRFNHAVIVYKLYHDQMMNMERIENHRYAHLLLQCYDQLVTDIKNDDEDVGKKLSDMSVFDEMPLECAVNPCY